MRTAPQQQKMHVAPQQQKIHVAPKQVQQQRVIQRHVVPQDGVQKKIGSQKYIGPKVGAPVTAKPRIISPKTGGTNIARKTFTPRSDKSRVVSAAKIRNMPTRGAGRTSIRGKNYSVWRSGYRARYHGGWRTFVGLGTLGVLAIGAAEYYPYAYINAPVDYCDGLTEDGCQLVWDEVETIEGDLVPQCVAYCPWQ